MASYHLSAPEKFDFDHPQTWPVWIQRFERFRTASKLSAEDEQNQIDSLIYAMGEQAEEIYNTFTLSAADAKVYEKVKTAFENHFVVKRNVIFERSKFNRRVQGPSESVDSFITALHSLADTCNYGTLKNELIRDRLVVGRRDVNLSEKLQLDSELTLDTAVLRARQSEQVKQQQNELRGSATQIDAVHRRPQNMRPRNAYSGHAPSSSKSHARPQKQRSTSFCKWCGKDPHDRKDCPAIRSKCHNCKKTGHFSSVCQSKKKHLNEVVEQPSAAGGDLFIGSIGTAPRSATSDPVRVKVKVDRKEVIFKLDTGADVTVMPAAEFHDQLNRLTPATKKLYGAGNRELKVLGKYTAKLSRRDTSTTEEIYVVEDLHMPLLGRGVSETLGLVSFNVDTIRSMMDIEKTYPGLSRPLGDFMEPYDAVLRDNIEPYSLKVPRRVAVPLLPKLKAELSRMKDMGVIRPITATTDWCSGIVVVPKKNGDIRICVDLTHVNEAIKRERLQLPSEAKTLGQLHGATVFSKLDATSSFWQIPLTPKTQLLTTFITPFGRYCFTRLPFGINSATEHYQRRMQQVLEGLEGVICRTDDVLIRGEDQKTHDERLHAALSRLEKAGAALNNKCEFNKSEIDFWGHRLNKDGVRPLPERTKVVANMPQPQNVTEVKRFLGMANQLGKFTSQLAEVSTPLRQLLSKDAAWTWDTPQQQAFQRIKDILCSSEILALYDMDKPTVVTADASSHGLGAALLQRQEDNTLRPVCYASRSLAPAELNYAQIEKEALASTWACEKFSEYLVGLKGFTLETDHKPLVPLLGTNKALSDLPPRLQRFRLRLMRFNYQIVHVPGKNIETADALSRAPQSEISEAEKQFLEDTNVYINSVITSMPASPGRMQELKVHQEQDELCQAIIHYCKNEWPDKHLLPTPLKMYWQYRGNFTIVGGLLLMDSRIFIPSALRLDILSKLHDGHQGITRTRARSRQSVWWPGISKQIEDMVKECSICAREQNDRREPLFPTPLPDRPWQRVGTDLLTYKSVKYITVVDYFSRYVEIAVLKREDSLCTINALKSIFARHGVPEEVMSDNGPQYDSAEFANFAKDYGFTHVTSSPGFPRANGAAERSVQTLKAMIRKAEEPYKALMAYRSTPLENSYSPTELLFGRRIRTTVPVMPSQLQPCWPDLQEVREKEFGLRERTKMNYDSRHRVTNLPELQPGEPVWIRDMARPGVVQKPHESPRSYVVETDTGSLRRNRSQLVSQPEKPVAHSYDGNVAPRRSKRISHKTERLIETI